MCLPRGDRGGDLWIAGRFARRAMTREPFSRRRKIPFAGNRNVCGNENKSRSNRHEATRRDDVRSSSLSRTLLSRRKARSCRRRRRSCRRGEPENETVTPLGRLSSSPSLRGSSEASLISPFPERFAPGFIFSSLIFVGATLFDTKSREILR